MDRKVLGSWLQGPRAALPADATHRGQRLGLPAAGPGSIAGFGSRLLAFVVDAVMCDLVALLVFEDLAWVTVVFLVEVLLLTWLQGASAGQRLLRLRIVRLDGRPVGLGTATMRTALLALLVPVLIWDRDGRGLHDRAAGTVLLRLR
jgi:uncharacterized RDD family membrane protein YckC